MSMTPIEIITLVLWIIRLLKAFGIGVEDVKKNVLTVLDASNAGGANEAAQVVQAVPDDILEGLFKWA